MSALLVGLGIWLLASGAFGPALLPADLPASGQGITTARAHTAARAAIAVGTGLILLSGALA
ncbi:hypothetical protein ACRAWG_31400 [Methylobacterium sp. P31]